MYASTEGVVRHRMRLSPARWPVRLPAALPRVPCRRIQRLPAPRRLERENGVGLCPPDGYRGRFDGDFRLGLSLWTQDYPRADRHFVQAIRRLTRIHVRSVEQPVLLEDGDAYDWPWLYAVQAGEWGLTQDEGRRLREYCLRGGFFFADDFHGPDEWAEFEKRIRFAFPDRPIVDIDDADAIFHTVYDINDRFVIPGAEHLREGSKNGGRVGRWVGIYDDKGRIMVVANFNQDTGDSWEWADSPGYPVKFSDLGIRLGVNYVMYAMTH